MSCPYTPEQNGVAERKHRHIIESTRTLLHQARLPLSFWADSALTAVYLINRLPSKIIKNLTPFQRLHTRPPEYKHLKVFGSRCFPWQPSTRRNKLQPKAPMCIFIGYSAAHKGYICYNSLTNSRLISRHVVFHEDQFDGSSSHISQTPSNPSTTPAITHPSFLFTPAPIPSPASTFVSSPVPSHSTYPLPPAPQPTTSPPIQSSPLPLPLPTSTHPMLTRLQAGTRKPKHLFTLTATSSTHLEPTTFKQAAIDPLWQAAMLKEFQALQQQKTWSLVDPPSDHPILGCRWTYRLKKTDRTSGVQHKARLVAQGYTQVPGVDYTATFSPVAKLPTIRLLLTVALNRNWALRQVDVSNAFLHGSLTETVYMKQPPGFIDTSRPSAVCRLHKTLYGLKQSPRAWYFTLTANLKRQGFTSSSADPSLFSLHVNGSHIYIAIYVDDLLLAATSEACIQPVVAALRSQFNLRELGHPTRFLGIDIHTSPSTYFLTQKSYLQEILQMAGMTNCRPANTPITTITSTEHPIPFANPYLYRKLAGCLQYLTITRPDIAFAVNVICQHMHAPLTTHYQHITRVLRYLQGTSTYGLPISKGPLLLSAFSDSDWAGDTTDRKSTSGHCLFLANTLVSWKVQKQKTVARSSTEAEYRALASTTTEVVWTRRLLSELGIPMHQPTSIYCDNTSTLAIANNPVLRARTKHIEIDQHFIREYIESGDISLHHLPSKQQIADILTKCLAKSHFNTLRSKLTIQPLDSHLGGS